MNTNTPNVSASEFVGGDVTQVPSKTSIETRRMLMAQNTDVKQRSASPVVSYRSVDVDGLDVFYREAGRRDAPTILLLHGFPTSSHMFRNLIPALADSYHVVAPDYPGFGQSTMPPRDRFAYTFDNLADSYNFV